MISTMISAQLVRYIQMDLEEIGGIGRVMIAVVRVVVRLGAGQYDEGDESGFHHDVEPNH